MCIVERYKFEKSQKEGYKGYQSGIEEDIKRLNVTIQPLRHKDPKKR